MSAAPWERRPGSRVYPLSERFQEDHRMRGIALWLLGVPIPVIILLYLFDVI